ncbi:MAG: hypothetical protein H6Q00_3464 [Holophagaceae bacterium]|nr:hypothetical protein [Holophagaceae bacterium]
MESRDRGPCPKCGRKLLEFSYQTLRLDQCSGCDGIWLDPGELEVVERLRPEAIFSLELEDKWARAREEEAGLSPGELEERRRQAHMRCPGCGAHLAEAEDRGIHVDRCTQCGGVWLDAGELDRVAGTERLMARLHRFLHK